MSEAHFIRTFRATFGETPNRYLQRRRVERAMFLLRSTDRSVTDICMDVGFSSLGTFSRVFRDIVGEPPSVYRRRGPLPPVPSCFAMAWLRPSSFGEALGGVSGPSVLRMLNALTITQIYVPDQDQALDFYVGKLGFEVTNDMRVRPDALADRRAARAARPGDPARAAGAAVDERGDRRRRCAS